MNSIFPPRSVLIRLANEIDFSLVVFKAAILVLLAQSREHQLQRRITALIVGRKRAVLIVGVTSGDEQGGINHRPHHAALRVCVQRLYRLHRLQGFRTLQVIVLHQPTRLPKKGIRRVVPGFFQFRNQPVDSAGVIDSLRPHPSRHMNIGAPGGQFRIIEVAAADDSGGGAQVHITPRRHLQPAQAANPDFGILCPVVSSCKGNIPACFHPADIILADMLRLNGDDRAHPARHGAGRT